MDFHNTGTKAHQMRLPIVPSAKGNILRILAFVKFRDLPGDFPL